MRIRKFFHLFILILVAVFIGSCGVSNENSGGTNGSSTNTRTISGYVIDDPVEGAEVYIDFGNGETSTKAITKSDGSFEIKLSDEDLAKINPEVPEGADDPIDALLIVAKKDGKVLRNAIPRDISKIGKVYITTDTEAYAEFLESIGAFDTNTLEAFNNELQNGRIEDSSIYANFIKDLRGDIRNYFHGGEKPSKQFIFEKALQDLDKSQLAKIADDKNILPIRNIVSGGDIILPDNVVSVSSDDIAITPKENGRYTLGDGNNTNRTVYLKIERADGTFAFIPVDIKSQTITEIANRTVNPTEGATLGSDDEGIKVVIPPFALNKPQEITIKKIETEGESADGKKVLDLEPHGIQFQVPITIKINYADFGIDDPYAVQWKYGSLDEGYDDADIVSVDAANKMIYLSIDHFSDLVIRKVNNFKFLDLGPNFVEFIPRRNYLWKPGNVQGKYGINETDIISNRLFVGSSFSNRKTADTMGGECVQTARTIFWSLMFGLYPTTYNGDAEAKIKSKTFINGNVSLLRQSFDDIQTGDLIWMNENNGVGHTFTVIKESNEKYQIVESNDVSGSSSALFPGKKYHKGNPAKFVYWERFGFRGLLQPEHFKTKGRDAIRKGDFIVLKNPKDLNLTGKELINAKANAERIIAMYKTIDYNGKDTDTKPYLYYLVSKIDDGIIKVGNHYVYNPDLLPVAPLRIHFDDNGRGKIQNWEDARYEIYAEYKSNASFKTNDSIELKYSNTHITLPSAFGNNIELTRLALKDNDNKTSLLMVGDFLNRSIFVSGIESPIKILFSPIVIDDYYVSWGRNNDNHNIPIGFWNSYGYKLEYKGKYTSSTSLEPGKIYASEDAVNGYFMTLGDGKSAEWHFTLAGPHAILINVPTGRYKDIENAQFTLHLNNQTIPLVVAGSVKDTGMKYGNSAFDHWFYLKTKNNEKITFDLTGNDYLEAKANGGIVVVDAIRLEGKKDRLQQLKLNGKADLSNEEDESIYKCLLKICNTDTNRCVGKIIPFGVGFNLTIPENLNKEVHLKFTYTPIITQFLNEPESTNIAAGNTSKRSEEVSVNTNAIKYKPLIQYITIHPRETEKNIPQVTLQPYGVKESVKIHLINAIDGSPIKDANVTVRYGIDNDDNQSIAYTGVTDENGYFEINNIPYGQYTAIFNKAGFISTSLNMKIDENSSDIYDLSMSPILPENEVRIVLTWGETPSDLDSHLVKVKDGNIQYHVYFANMHPTDKADLDHDDTSSFGPETITIHNLDANATYKYYVHDYSNGGNHQDEQLANSQATVKVYWGDRTYTYYVPNGIGNAWKVFEIVNGTLIPCTENCLFGVDGPTDSQFGTRSTGVTFSTFEQEIFKRLLVKH